MSLRYRNIPTARLYVTLVMKKKVLIEMSPSYRPVSGVYCETHCNGTQLIIKKCFEFIPQMSMSSESCLKWTTQGHNICSQQFYRNVHDLLMTFCNVGENKSFSLQEADMQFERGRDTLLTHFN